MKKLNHRLKKHDIGLYDSQTGKPLKTLKAVDVSDELTPASIAAKYDWHESKCFCGGNGWVMLVGTGAPNRKIACPDCSVNSGIKPV